MIQETYCHILDMDDKNEDTKIAFEEWRTQEQHGLHPNMEILKDDDLASQVSDSTKSINYSIKYRSNISSQLSMNRHMMNRHMMNEGVQTDNSNN